MHNLVYSMKKIIFQVFERLNILSRIIAIFDDKIIFCQRLRFIYVSFCDCHKYIRISHNYSLSTIYLIISSGSIQILIL